MSIGTYNSSAFHTKDDFKTLDDFFRFFYTQKNGYIYSAKKLCDGDFEQHSVSLERLNYDDLSDTKCRFADVVSGESYDRYFTLNQFCYIKGANRKPCLARRTDNIKRLNALYVDIDYYNLGLTKKQVYHALHDFLSDYGLPQYTMLIDSGRGFYVIWKLQNEDRNAHSRWEKIERLFCDRLSSLGSDPKAVDCSRVLRVPFSYNSKCNAMVGLVDFADVSYSLEELSREYLGERLAKKNHDNEEATQAMKNCANAISNTHNIPLPCNVDDKDSFNKIYAYIDEHKHLIKSVKIRYTLTGEIPFYRSIQCSQNAEDIATLMGLRFGRENGYREQSLFLYRTMLMWATNDAQIALERTLELNASFSTPLDEMTVKKATESAEKHFKKYNYCRKTLSNLLSISEEECSSLSYLSFAGDSRKHIRKRKNGDGANRTGENRKYYLRSLEKQGKTTKASKIDERRDCVLSLFNDGFEAVEMCEKLGISSSTLRRDMIALGISFADREIIVDSVSDDVSNDVEVAETLVITNNSVISFFKGCSNYILGATHRTEFTAPSRSNKSKGIQDDDEIIVGGVSSGEPPP